MTYFHIKDKEMEHSSDSAAAKHFPALIWEPPHDITRAAWINTYDVVINVGSWVVRMQEINTVNPL